MKGFRGMNEQVRYHVPLLHAFRDAYEKGDSRKARPSGGADADGHALSDDEAVRRRGLSESQVRDAVLNDIGTIFSTIDLQSAIDIADLDYVSKSVINFGLYDIMHLTSEDAGVAEIEGNIVAAVLSYEPRVRRDSLTVEKSEQIDDVGQKIRLSIYAEVSNRPVNIPVDFTAEVDLSTGAAGITQVAERS